MKLKKKDSGSALIVVLWTVVILAFAVAIASERVELVCSDATIEMKRYEAELLADSALASMQQILKKEK